MAKSQGFLDDLIASSEEQTAEIQAKEDEVISSLIQEINFIQNADLKSFVRCSLYNAPLQFWTMPSGELHPPDEQQEGGLVIHIKRVVRTVILIAEIQLRMPEDIDLLIAAALLHDIEKANSAVPNYLHSLAMDKFIENLSIVDETDADYHIRSNILNFILNYPEQLILLMRVIRAHEGAESPCPEMIPVTSLEQILNIANGIARNLDRLSEGREYAENIDGCITENIETQSIVEKD